VIKEAQNMKNQSFVLEKGEHPKFIETYRSAKETANIDSAC